MISSDSFLPGVCTMLRSLLASRPSACHVLVLYTPDTVCQRTLDAISLLWPSDCPIPLQLIPILSARHLLGTSLQVGSHEKRFPSCFAKLALWQLVTYDKILYIDADALVLRNLDFHYSRLDAVDFAAAPDVFPPDKFNAGVMMLRPSLKTYGDLVRMARIMGPFSYDGGDTGFLNDYFPAWFQSDPAARLPFRCNAQRTLHWLTARAQPGYWKACFPLEIVHYSSSPKPWECSAAPGNPSKRGSLEAAW